MNINEEIDPDPNIKVGMKSGKIINGIKRLCCLKVRVNADPILPIKLKDGVPTNIDKVIYINRLLGKPISKLNNGVIKRRGRKLEIQWAKLLINEISMKDKELILYKSRVPSI